MTFEIGTPLAQWRCFPLPVAEHLHALQFLLALSVWIDRADELEKFPGFLWMPRAARDGQHIRIGQRKVFLTGPDLRPWRDAVVEAGCELVDEIVPPHPLKFHR